MILFLAGGEREQLWDSLGRDPKKREVAMTYIYMLDAQRGPARRRPNEPTREARKTGGRHAEATLTLSSRCPMEARSGFRGNPLSIFAKVFADPTSAEARALMACVDVIEADGHLLEMAKAVLVPVVQEFEEMETGGMIN